MDLISELKRKQQKEPLIYESDRDGAIEDIITGEGVAGGVAGPAAASVCPPLLSPPASRPAGRLPHCLFATFFCLFFSFSFLSPAPPSSPSVLKTVPFTARTGKRTSRLLCEASLGEEIPL